MNRRRWLLHVVLKSLSYRKGRSLLLLAVLSLASSLVTSLWIVSDSMEKRVAEEVRHYGANLVIMPQSARMDVGSGGLNFGIVAEPAYLRQDDILRLLARHGDSLADYSLHLGGVLRRGERELPVEGVEFDRVRRLFSWWQMRGEWPAGGEAVAGTDLAARFSLKPGDTLQLAGKGGELGVRVSGIVSTGGEEDGYLFLDLDAVQRAMGLGREVSLVRLVAKTGGVKLERIASDLQAGLPGASVREVRQVARTSEALLRKVQVLMLLVTLVVVAASGGSVASTMSTTVLERGKEIGLLKAVGGSRREVLLIFASEASSFGLFGGILGYFAGVGLAEVVTRTVFGASAEFLPAFSLASVGVSLFLALLGSLGPMVAVFNLDPVQSLRGE